MRTVAFVLITVLPLVAHAEERVITYDTVLVAALKKSPESGKIDAATAERIAEAEEKGAHQNPSFGGHVRVPVNASNADTEVEVELSQPLRASDFGARGRLAEAMREASSVEHTLALLELSQNLALTYGKAWIVQEREGVLGKSRELAKSMLGKIREAGAKGLLPEADIAVFEGEVSLLEAELIGANADKLRGSAALTKLAGIQVANARLSEPPAPALPERQVLSRLLASTEVPSRRRAELMLKVAQTQVALARLDRYPAFAPSVGYERTAEGTDLVSIGVSVDLPFFNRNQAEITRAAGAEQAALKMKEYLGAEQLEEEALTLLDAAQALSTQRAHFLNSVIPARERALSGYRKQFEAGLGSISQVWQAQRELTESRLRALNLWSEHRAVSSELAVLIGQDF